MCAFPECGKHLTYDAKVGDDTYVGEAAHIRGEKPTAARYDASMTDEERGERDDTYALGFWSARRAISIGLMKIFSRPIVRSSRRPISVIALR